MEEKFSIIGRCEACGYGSDQGDAPLDITLTFTSRDTETDRVRSEQKIADYLNRCHKNASDGCEGQLIISKTPKKS